MKKLFMSMLVVIIIIVMTVGCANGDKYETVAGVLIHIDDDGEFSVRVSDRDEVYSFVCADGLLLTDVEIGDVVTVEYEDLDCPVPHGDIAHSIKLVNDGKMK